MNASKADQNALRIALRSIRISCSASAIRAYSPWGRRRAKAAVSDVRQIRSLPAPITSKGVDMLSGRPGAFSQSIERIAAASQPQVGMPTQQALGALKALRIGGGQLGGEGNLVRIAGLHAPDPIGALAAPHMIARHRPHQE